MTTTVRQCTCVNPQHQYHLMANVQRIACIKVSNTLKAIQFERISDGATIWLPKKALHWPKDHIQVIGESKVIIKDWFLEAKNYQLTFHDKYDNPITLNCTQEAQAQQEQELENEVYDQIIEEAVKKEEEASECYFTHLDNKEELNRIDQEHALAEQYEEDPKVEYFIWLTEGQPIK